MAVQGPLTVQGVVQGVAFHIPGLSAKGIDRREVKAEIELYYECVPNAKSHSIFLIMSARWWHIPILSHWTGLT